MGFFTWGYPILGVPKARGAQVKGTTLAQWRAKDTMLRPGLMKHTSNLILQYPSKTFFVIRSCEANQINALMLDKKYPNLNVSSINIDKPTELERVCHSNEGKSFKTLDPKRNYMEQFSLIEEQGQISLKMTCNKTIKPLVSSKFCLKANTEAEFCSEETASQSKGR